MSGLGRGVEKHADRKAGRCVLPLLYAPVSRLLAAAHQFPAWAVQTSLVQFFGHGH